MSKHKFWEGIWEITHIRNGKALYKEELRNALVDEGEENLLDTYFRDQNSPSAFYFRLCNDALAETDTLAEIQNEPSGNGYAAQQVERSTVGFPTLEFHDGDYRVVSKEITFTAGGGAIGPVNTCFVATTPDNTGKLIAYVPLSLTRTILDGDSMILRMRIKMK
jgi:hypothetical protein